MRKNAPPMISAVIAAEDGLSDEGRASVIGTPIQISALQRKDQSLCGGNIGCRRDVMGIAFTDQGNLDLHVLLCIAGIAKQDQKIHLSVGDFGCQLMGAAVSTGKKFFAFSK